MTATESAPIGPAPHVGSGASPAPGPPSRVAEVLPVRPRRSLSPSRAADFQSCPLLYRFRVIDALSEPPSPAAVRGTLVHSVLEALFDSPAPLRSVEQALALIEPQWKAMLEAQPELAEMVKAARRGAGVGSSEREVEVDSAGMAVGGSQTATGLASDGETEGDALAEWLGPAGSLVESYFRMEDPTQLEPAARELKVEATLPSGLVLRGFVDRLDVNGSGALRVVDYKTGRPPGVGFEARAMFQMRFYALAIWRMRGEVPAMLQLMYLSTGEVLRYEPDEADLLATQRKLDALWAAVERAMRTGDWRPNRGPLCNWCAHQALCPAWGGTPPPLPELAVPEAAAP